MLACGDGRVSTVVLLNPYQVGGGAPAFNPLTDVTWAAVYWASDPGWTPPADGAAVSSWSDGSGNSRTQAQATSGLRPLYRASVTNLNNRPAVEFDGVDDVTTNTSGFTVAQPFTVVAVVSAWGQAADPHRLFGSAAGNVQGAHGYPATNEVSLYAGGADFRGNSVTADTTSANFFTFLFDGAGSKIGKNGTLATVTATPGTTGVGTDFVLGNRSDGLRPGASKLAFLGVYSGDFAANGQYAAFKSWAATFYGLTIA